MIESGGINKWLINWFLNRNSKATGNIPNKTTISDLIESFSVIEFIYEIEKHYSIRFYENDFKSNHFQSIGGLTFLHY